MLKSFPTLSKTAPQFAVREMNKRYFQESQVWQRGNVFGSWNIVENVFPVRSQKWKEMWNEKYNNPTDSFQFKNPRTSESDYKNYNNMNGMIKYVMKNHFYTSNADNSIGSSKFKTWYILHGYSVFLNNNIAYPFVKIKTKPSESVQFWIDQLTTLSYLDESSQLKNTLSCNNQTQYFLKNVDSLEMSDLVHVIKILSKLPPKLSKMLIQDDLLMLLDKISVENLSQFNPKEDAILPYFQLLFSWFEIISQQIELRDAKDWTNIGIKYPQEFVKVAFQNVIENFSPGEMLFLMYVCGFLRNIPSGIAGKTTPYLQSNIVQTISKNWGHWNYFEKSVACMALHLCKIKISQKRHEALKKCVKDSFLCILNDMMINRYTLEIILNPFLLLLNDKALGQFTFNESEIQQIMLRFGPLMNQMPYQSNVKIVQIISNSGASGSELETFIRYWTDSLQPLDEKILSQLYIITLLLFDVQFHEFSKPDIEYSIFQKALYSLTSYPKNMDDWFLHRSLEAVDLCPLRTIQDVRHYIGAIVYMSKMGIIQDTMVHNLMSKVNEFHLFQDLTNSLRADDEDLKEFVKIGLKFLLSISHLEITDQDLSRQMQRQMSVQGELSQNINTLHSLAELDYLIELDFPNYSGNRMDSCIRNKLIQMVSANIIPGAMSISEANQNRQVLYQGLQRHFSSKDVFFGPILPYYTEMSDILLCVDQDLQTIPIPQTYRLILEGKLQSFSDLTPPTILQSSPKKNHCWFCVILPKEKHFNQNGSLKGHMKHKVKHLRKLGFKVIIVPERQFNFKTKKVASKYDIQKILMSLYSDTNSSLD